MWILELYCFYLKHSLLLVMWHWPSHSPLCASISSSVKIVPFLWWEYLSSSLLLNFKFKSYSAINNSYHFTLNSQALFIELKLCTLLPTSPYFPPPPAPCNHFSTFCFYEFDLLGFFFLILHRSDTMQYLSIWLIPFSIMSSR